MVRRTVGKLRNLPKAVELGGGQNISEVKLRLCFVPVLQLD